MMLLIVGINYRRRVREGEREREGRENEKEREKEREGHDERDRISLYQASEVSFPVADPDHLVTGGDSFPARFRGG